MTSWRTLGAESKHRALVPLGVVVTSLALLIGGSACSESKAAGNSASGAMGSGAGICGDKDLPDCPLQNWMKATLRPYLNAQDTVRLAGSLEQLAEKAPPGYAGWRETALTAANAARSGDLSTAKTECKHCHDQHRNRFRTERRTIALF